MAVISVRKLDTTSCEAALFTFKTRGNTSFNIINIYRPPKSRSLSSFLDEYHQIVSDLDQKESPFIITGDYNIHFDKPDSKDTKVFLQLLQDNNLKQHVQAATHKRGHILDWVVTPTNEHYINRVDVKDKDISDHYLVKITLGISKAKRPSKIINSRNIKALDRAAFINDLASLFQSGELEVDEFNSALRSILDKHCPQKQRKISHRKPSPWFNDSVKNAKKEVRRAERRWMKTGLEVHREIYIARKNHANNIILKAKRHHYLSKFDNISTCRELFNVCDEVLGKDKCNVYPDGNDTDIADKFCAFFENKVQDIRDELDSAQCNPVVFEPFTGTLFDSFRPATVQEVKQIILNSPSKSCDLDPIPTCLLKENLDVLLPSITNIINASLVEGVVPSCFKYAIVTPLLKKKDLDTNIFKNYRPVSNLPFLSKILEKIVLKRLLDHLDRNNLHEIYQSAYKENHSTETALLKVFSDICSSLDDKNLCLLTMYDLSAAFDTIDHDILLKRLGTTFGIGGSVIRWFESYLSDRKQCVTINKNCSKFSSIRFGVPQGSVLGPILFSMYMKPLASIIERHGIKYHFYADDTQTYSEVKCGDLADLIGATEQCANDLKDWMLSNKLKLNDDKTEAMLFINNKHHMNVINDKDMILNVNGHQITMSKTLRNLGVIMDPNMTMSSQIGNLCRTLRLQLKKIASIRSYLPTSVAKTLITSLILSRLDYCNSLLAGTNKEQINRLQRVQNAAAKLVLCKKQLPHSLPILYELHWLPVKERIDYKIALICYKCINDSAPVYLSSLLEFYTPNRNLRSSSDKYKLKTISRVNYKSFGEKSFAWSGPKIWNSLPLSLRSVDTIDTFKRRLKHYLFLSTYC